MKMKYKTAQCCDQWYWYEKDQQRTDGIYNTTVNVTSIANTSLNKLRDKWACSINAESSCIECLYILVSWFAMLML